MYRRHRNNGFTLVELLIGMAMMAVLMAAIAGVLSSSMNSFSYSMSKAHSLQPARTAINQIGDSVRYTAAAISNPALGSSGNELDFTDSTSNSYRIYVPSTGSNANTIIITKNGIVASSLAAGMVQPTSVSFIRDATDASKLTIRITLNDNAYSNSPGTTVSSLFALANM